MISPLRRHSAEAFTFIEVIAAMLFLAILVPAVVAGLTIANRTSVMSERSSIAGELAENKLNELLLNNTWQSSSGTKGDFAPQWPGYTWQMTTPAWQGDTTSNMTELDVEVSYMVQGRPQTVRLGTLVTTGSQSS